MGKSLSKIVSTIRNQLTAHAVTDDSRLEPELIEDMILDVRSSLIREFYRGTQYLEDSFYQIYDGLEISHQQLAFSETVKEKFPELYVDLPTLQSEVGFKNIKYLGSVDGRHNFTRVSMTGFISSDGRLFSAEDPIYTVNGNRALIKNLPNLGLKYLKGICILYDPRKAPGFNREIDFPVPDSMVHKLELICIKQFMSTLGIPPDIHNDAQDISLQPQQQQRQQ